MGARVDDLWGETGDPVPPTPDTNAFDRSRTRMFWWRAQFIRFGLPVFLTWVLLPLFLDVPVWVTTGLGILAALLCLTLGGAVLCSLFLFAREVGGTRYATGQLSLAVWLFFVAFFGVIFMPLLVDSDAAKHVAAWRRATARPAWFVALDTVVVLLLLGLAVGLTAVLGLPGLMLGTLLVPLLYGGFLLATRPLAR
jgi:hypothetical protein